jgi:signal transduction histidine kinase
MSVTIFTVEVHPGELADLRLRTRQIAGLLGFKARQQAEVSAAVSLAADAAVESTGAAEVAFTVEGTPQAQVFRILISSSAPRPSEPGGAMRRSIFRLVDFFEVDQSDETRTTVALGKEFPPGTPAVAGEALARVAGELARRSRPGSVFTDIQKQNQELFDSIKDLARLNRELEGYAHAVSHDLKGPLTDILLANELLRGKLEERDTAGSDQGVRVLVNAIKDNVRRSAYLIDDLLALAEAGQVPAEVSEVAVLEMVERVLSERSVFIVERGVTVEVDEDLGKLAASPTHIYQLFANLIGNAVKNCPASGGAVEVRLLDGAPQGGLVYLVRDNGPGIPEEELGKIFLPFFRGGTGDTGVGLAIVDKVVRLYNGEIDAYNDSGACFRFVLRDWVLPTDA